MSVSFVFFVKLCTLRTEYLESGEVEKELMGSGFSPTTLEDIRRVSGTRIFGALPVSEGYVVLIGGGESGSPQSPSEILLSALRWSCAAHLCCLCLSVGFLCLILSFEIMGQSLTTPLSVTLEHWPDVRNRASNQSVEVEKKKWKTLCSSEWLTFNVGWPEGGIFDLNIISQVKR